MVYALAADAGRVYAGGDFTFIGNQTRHFLAALDADGFAVNGWDPNLGARVYAIETHANHVYAGGQFVTAGTLTEYCLVGLILPQDALAVPAGRSMPQIALASFPNPARAHARLGFALAEGGIVTLSVFDAAGRQVANLADHAWLSPGRHEFSFEPGNLPAGCYFARLESGRRIGTTCVVVVR